MPKLRTLAPALLALLLTPSLCFASHPALPQDLSIVWVIPFACMLLSIALCPLTVPHFWEHHFGKVAVFWGLAFLVPCLFVFGFDTAFFLAAETLLLEYMPFILLLLAACALPMHWIELRCNTQPARDRYVEFISDRRRVRLETERISYLESNDSEVWIHTSTGESLRTKTKISQWEQQLDDRFLRIHRSYIVNADRVARHTAGAVVVDGRTLEVSRKYRDSVRAAIPESAPSARVRHISNDKPS